MRRDAAGRLVQHVARNATAERGRPSSTDADRHQLIGVIGCMSWAAVRRVPTVFDRLTERTLWVVDEEQCAGQNAGRRRSLVAILIGTVTRDRAGAISRRRLQMSAKAGNLP